MFALSCKQGFTLAPANACPHPNTERYRQIFAVTHLKKALLCHDP